MYRIGIDLGTTNSAVAYTRGGPIQLFRIPQLNAQGILEPLATLPSFLYLDKGGQVVGEWAREQGAKVPTRLVESAKSWLCNQGANRREKILPLEADGEKISPVAASAAYLLHMRDAWNGRFKEPFEEQEIVLTVPASFDEVARSLTVEAANRAGLSQLTLLEEPQAAFYNWILEHEKQLETLQPGETILVVDVGGGTTDFSLIEVTHSKGFQRMRVGKHLLLGGDNMDVALCHHVGGEELDMTQWLSLKHQTRKAKESILEGKATFPLWIPGGGSQVVGGGRGLTLTRTDIESVLLEGFFGLYDFDEACSCTQGSGIRTMGLPFEREPAITKHLAIFLRHSVKPTYVLFNGGTMKALPFQKRIFDSLNRWFPQGKPVVKLISSSLDLAVAKGAAYYGNTRQGIGVKIGGGIPRTYYLEMDKERVVTLLPKGTEEGSLMTVGQTYFLLPNTPVAFQLYYSHTRLDDQIGGALPFEEETMTALPPIRTVLRFGAHREERIPVTLSIQLTTVGTIELWLASEATAHRWKLEFQIDAYTKAERLIDETFDHSFLEPAKDVLLETFAIGSQDRLKNMVPMLESAIKQLRAEWSPSILRGLFDSLLLQAEKRNFSDHYAVRFWNLVGFFLRPGKGYPLDDFRIKQIWKLFLADAKKPTSEEVQIQKMICYRRIAAGLSKGQQMHLFSELIPKKWRRRGDYIYSEQVRAKAALELIDTPLKVKMGEELIERVTAGEGGSADFWALGRVGGRELLYGGALNVIPAKICEQWIERLLKISNPELAFALALMARKTDCKEINLSPKTVESVNQYLTLHGGAPLMQERELTQQELEKCFGDSLPHGLHF